MKTTTTTTTSCSEGEPRPSTARSTSTDYISHWHFSCPTSGERSIRGYAKFDFTVDEGKGRLNPSRDKNKGKHRRSKVDEKSCVTSLLCNPGWCVHKSDVQNKWDDNTTHTHTENINSLTVQPPLLAPQSFRLDVAGVMWCHPS